MSREAIRIAPLREYYQSLTISDQTRRMYSYALRKNDPFVKSKAQFEVHGKTEEKNLIDIFLYSDTTLLMRKS